MNKKDTGQQNESADEKEMEAKIIAQAEFYLSEDYLMKNAYLLRQVARKRNGFLSIKFISSFKRMRELSRDWQTTAKALIKSEKLELSDDGMKVRRRMPLTPFISSIKSIKSVLVTSNEELTVSGITAWLALYGEIVYVQVIKPGMEIPENLRVYASKHSELGNRPVGVVEFETPEAAHRCCRELDSGQDGENARICLLGTRIRSFARHRRKKDSLRFESENLGTKNFGGKVFNKERLSPTESADSAISDGSSSQEGSLPRDLGHSQWTKPRQNYGFVQRPGTIGFNRGPNQHSPWKNSVQNENARFTQNYKTKFGTPFGPQPNGNIDHLRNHQQKIYMQEKLLQAARIQYQSALILAQQRQKQAQHQLTSLIPQFNTQQNHFFNKKSYAAPPPGLEPESETPQISDSIHYWLDKLSISD